MKLSPPNLVCALAFALAFTPAICLAEYQLAENALEQLENCVTLTPAQQEQALQIFQNLKDAMDKIDPADRPMKGSQLRQDAKAAIRAILTPEQQAIYDRTPQRLGGGSTKSDPGMRALTLKISAFVRETAQHSPKIAAEVGTIQRVITSQNQSSMLLGDPSKFDDPALHPRSGTNLVRVTGSLGAKGFRIYWKMDDAGEMTLDRIEDAGG